MQHYPICTFKEFYIDATVAKAELRNWSSWKLWNSVSMVETDEKGALSLIYLDAKPLTDFLPIQFVLSPKMGVDEFVLRNSISIQDGLNLEWIIIIKGKNREQLLINTILLKGDLAPLYYAKHASYFTRLLKVINRDFIQYLNRKYLDRKWFGEDISLYGSYLR